MDAVGLDSRIYDLHLQSDSFINPYWRFVMGKNIVFCADGTWNGPGEEDNGKLSGTPTNVFKLFLNLDGADTSDALRAADEQERVALDPDGQSAQVSKYLHGVGDGRNPLVKLLGGAFGAGLIARVVRGYTFISRNFSQGDRIFLIGFSRGAYTARALAGLIAKQGLLDGQVYDLADKDSAYRLGSAVWCRHQKSQNTAPVVRLESFMADLPGFFSAPPDKDRMVRAGIHAVAVWDTVGAMGIPVYAAKNENIDMFKFADTRLNAEVRWGLHAVSVDEQRKEFIPTLWGQDQRVTQVLFPGAHADVGGGYAASNMESGLSDAAFVWMRDELEKKGIRFLSPPVCVPVPDPRGTAHQPWRKFPWAVMPNVDRVFPKGLGLHQSVIDRAKGGAVIADPGMPAGPYVPTNLKEVYMNDGQVLPGVDVIP